MSENPLVSIVVPVYNVEKELSRCVNSLINQTYRKIEIVLVDDGSPDKCPLLCDEYAKQDSRIHVIHKKNGGLSDARNEGVKSIQGEWFLFVDSDDFLELDAVDTFISFLQKNQFNESLDIIVGVVKEISLDGKISYQKHTNLESGKIYSSKEYITSSIKRKEFFAPACLNLYKTEFWYKFKQEFKVGIYYEDLDLVLKVFLSANNVLYIDYPFYNYVKREGSITVSGNYQKRLQSAKIVLEDIFENIRVVQDIRMKKILYKYFSNIYLVIIGKHKILEKCYPKNCTYLFLLMHAFNFKDFLKLLILGISQKLYVSIYR